MVDVVGVADVPDVPTRAKAVIPEAGANDGQVQGAPRRHQSSMHPYRDTAQEAGVVL